MMKVVVALDSFKGTLSAAEACTTVRDGLLKARPNLVIELKPMADGGEGTAAAMLAARSGEWIRQEVMGPLPEMSVHSGYAWFPRERQALIEMAAASGITLLRPSQLNPLRTTTFGTGQLLRAAFQKGARSVLLAVGGSATVDGGVGAAMALGWRFLDAEGAAVGLGGGELTRIRLIEPPALDASTEVPVEVLCDVDNPLCGEQGAARVFGPQKGATPEMVTQLDDGLRNLAQTVHACLGTEIAQVPGSGAAGGLAAGAMAFLNARLVPGISTVMQASRLQEALSGADWVITGEGRFDSQSLRGKVVAGVTAWGRQAGARVAVLAGSVELRPEHYRPLGIEIALATRPPGMDLEEALANAKHLLAERAADFASRYL